MSKKLGIIGAAVAAVAFGGLAVGTTYAIFTANKSKNVHIQTGSLDAKLYLTSLVRDEVDSQGLWVVDKEVDITDWEGYEEGKGVDLSVYSGYVFDGILLIPGMTGTATFRLYNTGNIAFNYSVDKVIDNENSDPELVDDMIITCPTSSGLVLSEGYSDFTFGYEFRDDGLDDNGDGANNDAMGQTMSLDILVRCSQVERPTSSSSMPEEP